jgi:hypothetical protein
VAVSRAEKISNGKDDVGKRLGCYSIAAVEETYLLVAIWGRMSMHLQVLLGDVQEPGFRDSGLGVDRKFDLTVFLDRCIGHFDDEIHVLSLRMRAGIEIGTRT